MPEVIVNITQENGLLLFTQLPGSLGFSYLKPITDHAFEVIYRPGLACMAYGLGQNRERVFFDPPSTDKKSPGLKFGPFIFKRTLPVSNNVLKPRTPNLQLSPSSLLWQDVSKVIFLVCEWNYYTYVHVYICRLTVYSPVNDIYIFKTKNTISSLSCGYCSGGWGGVCAT